jgi:hypothetical protein
MPETTEPESQAATASTLSRLAGRGEETIKRLSEEIDKNPRMHDARDRLDKLGRSMLQQLNVAFADDVEELKKEVTRLERRLAKLEKTVAGRPSTGGAGNAPSGDA